MGKSSISEIVQIGNAHGYDITSHDVSAYVREQNPQLTEEELDAVSAGQVGIMGVAQMIGILPK